MNLRNLRGLLWGLALLGFTADLATKYAAFRHLGRDGFAGEREIVPGVFKLIVQFSGEPIESGTWRAPLQAANGPVMPRVNNGALFGIGNGYRHGANSLFAVVSVVAAAGIVLGSRAIVRTNDKVLCAALGFILGGTCGNLFDRVVFHGVRDFLYFYWIEWPVFNVADCCLVAGAGLLLLQAFWPKSAKHPQSVDSAAQKQTTAA